MAPVPGDSREHQLGTSMPQGGHPPHHSITSSARGGRMGGRSRPRALAVLRVVTSSNLVGVSIGRSSGFSPAIIFSTYPAIRLASNFRLGPYEKRHPASTNSRHAAITGSRYQVLRIPDDCYASCGACYLVE